MDMPFNSFFIEYINPYNADTADNMWLTWDDLPYSTLKGLPLLAFPTQPNFLLRLPIPHGAFGASLRLPKEKKCETRVFR